MISLGTPFHPGPVELEGLEAIRTSDPFAIQIESSHNMLQLFPNQAIHDIGLVLVARWTLLLLRLFVLNLYSLSDRAIMLVVSLPICLHPPSHMHHYPFHQMLTVYPVHLRLSVQGDGVGLCLLKNVIKNI
eukprot:Lithocolla_globosa_v1_NODE_40_length_8230_cov_45.875581.p4 type:complete len:131 gc:universal NODE_40_length_8230_cov_45.875581:2111-2503(+)